jgi:PAS domain S-box-containing protein
MTTIPTAVIVNDDPVQLKLAARILERDGFSVLSCLGAEEALRLLSRRGEADVIVTDLHMPGIDGWRFCRLLRSSAFSACNAIPILVVSAIFSGADTEEMTAQLGADGFLAAPYEPATLCRVVRGLIGNDKPVNLNSVLMVEPDGALAEKLTANFQSNGYSVTRAADGDAAMALFKREPRQIVLLDYDHSPALTERVIDTIKQPGTPSVVIVMTSDTSAELALDVIRKGADNYIHKPPAPDHLLKLCETAARQRALLRIQELLELRTRRLRASEERYRSLFENAGDGIATYTVDGVLISVNRTLEILLDAVRDRLVGNNYSKLMTAASLANSQTAQEQARLNRDEFWVYEIELARPDGTTVPVEARCRFLRGKGGEPSMVMAMYRDITAVKKLERQRAEFSAMLAHDIRNPVGLIRGYTELLTDGGAPLEAAKMRQCHFRIRDAADVIASLVNNYLDVSRIEAGQLELSKQPVDLAALLRRVVERFEGAAQARSIRFEFSSPESSASSCAIEGDALALDRVFANLLNNAFKFTPWGGAIGLTTDCRGSDVVVAVRDTGPGIDPQKLPSLFEKFNRIEITERQEGLGLGLFIVRKLVAAHGGRVEVSSVVGAGSCFSVYLPLAIGQKSEVMGLEG